jgi:YD repeat-containing protein
MATSTTPEGSLTTTTFNERGLLSGLTVNLRGSAAVTPVVVEVTYDARGERQSIVYGNGVTTSYAYDPATFRLVNLTSTRPGDSTPLQDLTYTYDPVGNITRTEDAAQQTVFFANQVVTPTSDYTYDAIYRLVRATGREHVSQAAAAPTT